MKREYEFTSFDGKNIHVTEYAPEGEIVAMVQVVHGMAEHVGRYESFLELLAKKGFLVFGDDHRGHGKTDPDSLGKGEDLFGNTLKDEAALSKYYTETYPGKKLILYGHSYGSCLSQAYLASSYNRFLSGAVLSGSTVFKGADFNAGLFVARLQCLFGGKNKPANLIEKLSFQSYNKKLKGSFITSVEAEAERYQKDPYCAFTCSAGFYRSFFSRAKKLYGEKASAALRKDLPMLLIAGNSDPVGKMGKGVLKLADFYKNSGVEDLECVLLSGSRHEFLNDVGREEGIRAITDFLFRVAEQGNDE